MSKPSRVVVIFVALALAVAACSDDSSTASEGGAPDPTSSRASTDTDVDTDVVDGTATIDALDHPLLADLQLELPADLVPVVRLVGPDTTVDVPVPVPGDAATEHVILLAGMRADTDYTVEVDLVDEAGVAAGHLEDITHTTGSLPEGLPPMTAAVSEPEQMAGGLTMFNLLDLRDDFAPDENGDGSDEPPPPAGWIVMVDEAGEVVWYHNTPHPIGDVTQLADGTILHEFNDTAARRIDLRGETLEEWAGTVITGRLRNDAFGRQVVGDDPVVVDTDAMHHDHQILPDGTHATLSTELRVLDGFPEPQCGEDPATFDGTYHLVGDIVTIFEPDTGEIVEEFNLFDYFDPRSDPAGFNLCGLDFDFVFPNWVYREVDGAARDWTHANAIELDEANNTLIISIRHLDALIGLRWQDDAEGEAGDLLWHSGPRGDMELLSGEWHLHQHAPEVQPDGTLLLYDNGNNREGLGGPDAPLYSRAVVFAIDPDAGTVEQLWEHRSTVDDAPAFAAFVGDADFLENGNVLITDGGLNGLSANADLSAQLVEVVPDVTDGEDEVVFRFEVEGGPGWLIYRSERIPSVYGSPGP